MRFDRAYSVSLLLVLLLSGVPAAAQRQDFLVANVDSSVSPREDFFQYANGLWFRRHPIPENASEWGTWNESWVEVDARLRRISEDAAGRRAPKGSLEQLVGDFWFTGMDSVTLNRQGLAPLRPDLDRIDRIRSTSDLLDVVATLHARDQWVGQTWSRPLFIGRVEKDQTRDRWIYSLSRSGISMASPAYYSGAEPEQARVRTAFREYLLKTFLRLQQDSARATASANAVFELEARLAHSFDAGGDDEKIGLEGLRRLAPTIDWDRYFRQIGATGIDSVRMAHPRFYQALDTTLRTTALETWKDYLRLWLVKTNAPFLDDVSRTDYFVYQRNYSGTLRQAPRWRGVLTRARDFVLPQPLARLFEKEYLPPRTRARHEAVAESFRAAFRDRIKQLDWMSDSTKQRALAKLDRLKITIGMPATRLDFGTMPLARDAYALNVMRASKWYRDVEMKQLNQPVDRSESDPRLSLGEGWYDQERNEVAYGAGRLMGVPGLRDEDLDDAFVYGSSFLAHEISHAFDSNGRHYDADGNRVDWWTARDASAFDARAQLLIDQYNEFMPLEGVRVNGKLSLPENMADLVGLRIVVDAFKKTEQYKRNERIGGFTPLQRFFLAYAYARAGHERKEALAARLRGGAYAPDRERVNGALMNIPEFYEAFGVRPGDRMHRPDHARVKIW